MANRKIVDLLDSDHHRFSPLQTLLQRAELLSACTAELRALLPKGLKSSCRVVDATPPVLKVACRSAAAATKLRFLGPELIEQLHTLPQYVNIERLSVRVVEG